MIVDVLGDCQEYVEETYEEFASRYDGYGKDLYSLIKCTFPIIFNKLKFYKATVTTGKCVGYAQTEDSYCVFNGDTNVFTIQLDYYSTIVFGNADMAFTYEVGDWSETAYKDALDFISNHFDKITQLFTNN